MATLTVKVTLSPTLVASMMVPVSVGESAIGELAERGARANGGKLGSLIDDGSLAGAGAVEAPGDDFLDGS